MKSDNYLTLCLEQAAKSPLHYRHGAIVVRGGKVIGTGYNCYKPGFDGGALKHGRIANGGSDGEAIAALKLKMKALKQKDKNQQDHRQQQPSFVPVENMPRGSGGGPNVNTPLSMHSEMMAIHSALAASSTLSSTAFSREKPCFKLPCGDNKRKSRLRADVLRAYVAQVMQHNIDNDLNKEGNVAGCVPAETDSAFHASASGVKHHWKKNWKGKHHHKKSQYEGKYRQYEYEAKHGGQQQSQQSACKESGKGMTRGHDLITSEDDNGKEAAIAPLRSVSSIETSQGKDCKRVGAYYSQSLQPTTKLATQTMKGRRRLLSPAQQHLLLPTGRTGDVGHSVAERKKNPRLQGADLYVTRLGWSGTAERKEKKKKKSNAAPANTPDAPSSRAGSIDSDLAESISSLSSLGISSADCSSTPGSSCSSTSETYASLHEEYMANNPCPPAIATCCETEAAPSKPPVSASRPCYRCITFMHAVGIRRVFWTNASGEWEGGKVKDFVDGMDGATMEGAAGGEEGGSGGPMGNGVFVTKHEVLMMRRIMGARSAADAGKGATKRK